MSIELTGQISYGIRLLFQDVPNLNKFKLPLACDAKRTCKQQIDWELMFFFSDLALPVFPVVYKTL